MKTSFLSQGELKNAGFKSYGTNVLISRHACFYNAENISIGNNVRIDDFCILSGHIDIGSYIHISAYSALYGSHQIILEDFTTLSGRILIYTASDDYSGEHMTNPTLPDSYTNVSTGQVICKKHAIVGAGCVILPNITLQEGVAVGAMSLVNKTLDAWSIYSGIPAKFLKKRKTNILELEKKLLSSIAANA